MQLIVIHLFKKFLVVMELEGSSQNHPLDPTLSQVNHAAWRYDNLFL
jgi:hypothetical protein